ncbi:hypothetical protein WH52_05765 [Tenacibaculum holothuriorum]|uniref:DM13 domain-containing protein n=1 Tax=Tenacibaculum holothuriorum TaxID=1635173 RepID=A0A1Y2PEY8_9FLAO|nr:Ig-like domain-containing protein [Tenacibaculum holothuriorum]OSY88279.1 hypothetical protein WH52_05765 [Tenacibaculum holothuriorum]
MKHFKLLFLFLIILQSCVENDIVDDRVDEKLTINNPIEKITLNTTYQYTTKYTNNVGQTSTPTISWSSSESSIISVSNNGLITALAEGNAIITASTTTEDGKTITTNNTVLVTTENIDNNGPKEKSGTLSGSYSLRGTFTLKEIPNSNDLELSINADYNLSSGVPGPYLYLSNNPNTVIGNGSKEISRVTTFSGTHAYIIKDTKIGDFKYVFYWCKPFGVKIGIGEIK